MMSERVKQVVSVTWSFAFVNTVNLANIETGSNELLSMTWKSKFNNEITSDSRSKLLQYAMWLSVRTIRPNIHDPLKTTHHINLRFNAHTGENYQTCAT